MIVDRLGREEISENFFGVAVGILLPQFQCALRNIPQSAPPEMVSDLHRLIDHRLRPQIPLPAHGAAVLYLYFSPPFVLLPNDFQNPLQHIDRLKTADDNGSVVRRRYRFVDFRTRDDADVGRADERVDPRGKPYYWIGGEAPTGVDEPGTDFGALRARATSPA